VDPDATGAASAEPGLSSSKNSNEGRFSTGGVVGERFRILGRIGRGGMGEVYRAHDLKLDQPVALKFLPEATARDNRRLEFFRNEVRIARQISHRNVCRVYDLGEIEGAPFISMEYVDGEDLGSLLRRIGRLPGDKAVEFARRLCAGLAAAHEKGVLHRDLKPANIMIDGRGQVLIMDFGLAAVADGISGGDIRSGTPAYMSPEQKDGREVTVRSDIYSLGLVLAEMFTGQRASQDGRLSTSAKDVDPAVEKLIERCLDPNPSRRPASALDVARALPGGDPLAEALAAGDTPSPAMVAASEDTGALSVRSTVLCLAFIVVGITAAILLSGRTNVLRRMPFPDSPEILARKAHDLAVRVGYTVPPADSAYGFVNRPGPSNYAQSNLKPSERVAFITNPRTSTIFFWYRESPRDLASTDPFSSATIADPPLLITDMVRVLLDSEGHLLSFGAVPPQEIASSPARPIDWAPLFQAAGLDPAQWTPAKPKWNPSVSFDEQASWTGTFSHVPSMEIRIDAAAWRGRPVQFDINGPWTQNTRDRQLPQTTGRRTFDWLRVSLLSIVLVAAVLLAVRHHRHGRGDPQGALRLAALVFVCTMMEWLLLTHHVGVIEEFSRILAAMSGALFNATLLWTQYMALEPYVRRRWPQSLISWTRALTGGLSDSVVAGHILMGIALGVGYTLLFAVDTIVGEVSSATVRFDQTAQLLGPRTIIGNAAGMIGEDAFPIAFGLLFLFFLLRAALRRSWLAAVVVVILGATQAFLPATGQAALVFAVFGAIIWGFAVLILMRFGVLPLLLAIFVSTMLGNNPLTTDFSVWYASSMFTALAIVLAITLWSFRTALGGRKLIAGDLLEN
jgi:serine/threonine-protein kinase